MEVQKKTYKAIRVRKEITGGYEWKFVSNEEEGKLNKVEKAHAERRAEATEAKTVMKSTGYRATQPKEAKAKKAKK